MICFCFSFREVGFNRRCCQDD